MANHHSQSPAATMPAAAVDWSSLSADFVSCVGDIFLADGDVDYYMSLRAVCRCWRAATADPRGPDRRFNPQGWAMLEPIGTQSDYARCVLLHVHTGRLLSKDLPMLRDYISLSFTTDGHLVLQNVRDHLKLCVLNPFTGHQMVRFSLTPEFTPDLGSSMVVASGSSPMLHTFLYERLAACIDLTSGTESMFTMRPGLPSFTNVVVFQGRVYGTGFYDAVMVVEDHTHGDKEPMVTTVVSDWSGRDCPSFLVDNAGELLLLHLMNETRRKVQVFRVNVENKSLEKISCIGNRAIFLSPRCLSVAVDNLPTIEANCIYYVGGWSKRKWLYMYRLEDDKVEIIGEPHIYPYFPHYAGQPCFGPISLAGYILITGYRTS